MMAPIYFSTLVLTGLLTLLRFRMMDLAGRFVCGLIWLGISTEAAGWYTSHLFGSNQFVYNLAVVLELLLFALYFNYSIPGFRKWNLGYYIAGLAIGLAWFCWRYLSAPGAFGSVLQIFACLVVLFMAAFAAFERILLSSKRRRLLHDFHFWVAAIVLVYQFFMLLSWAINSNIFAEGPERQPLLNTLVELNGIVVYIFLATLLALYPRLKKCLWLIP